MSTEWQKYAKAQLHELLPQGEQSLKRIRSINNSIGRLIKSPDKKEIEMFIQATSDVPQMVAWEIERLANALNEFGWWRKRVALSLISDLQVESVKFLTGIGILSAKVDV